MLEKGLLAWLNSFLSGYFNRISTLQRVWSDQFKWKELKIGSHLWKESVLQREFMKGYSEYFIIIDFLNYSYRFYWSYQFYRREKAPVFVGYRNIRQWTTLLKLGFLGLSRSGSVIWNHWDQCASEEAGF